MNTVSLFVFILGLIILPIATCHGNDQFSVPFESKAIVKRRGPSPPPHKANPNYKRAHKSKPPPAGTHSPAGSSTGGGHGAGFSNGGGHAGRGSGSCSSSGSC